VAPFVVIVAVLLAVSDTPAAQSHAKADEKPHGAAAKPVVHATVTKVTTAVPGSTAPSTSPSRAAVTGQAPHTGTPHPAPGATTTAHGSAPSGGAKPQSHDPPKPGASTAPASAHETPHATPPAAAKPAAPPPAAPRVGSSKDLKALSGRIATRIAARPVTAASSRGSTQARDLPRFSVTWPAERWRLEWTPRVERVVLAWPADKW
jgi:hypothetical protein